MRTRILMGVVFLTALMFNAIAIAQTDLDESLESLAPPKLGVSGESVTVEEEGDVLKLYWSGWIDLVKPSQRGISVSVRCTFDPAGKWRTRPRNLALPDTFAQGVNSSYHKIDLAEIDLPGTGLKEGHPPVRSFFTEDQVVTVRISLKQQRTSKAAPSLEEREYKLSPLSYLLLSAVKSGDLKEVTALLESGVRPDSADIQGWSALMTACSTGRMDIVRLLVEKNANLVAQTKGFAFSESANGSPIPRGATPLMAAAYAGNADVVKFLIDSGATYGDYVKRIRRKGASDEEIATFLENSGPKHQEIVNRLLQQGADRRDIDALLNRGGFADIVWRISKNGMLYTGIAERLKESGASKDVIASRLKKKGADDEDVRKAIQGRWPTDEAIRQTLLDKGATKDEADLLLNERKLSDDAVRVCLKDKGVKPEEIESLLRDKTRDDETIRAFLREKGVPAEDADGCLNEKGAQPEEIVKFLTQHGGSVDALRGDRWTPLIAASFSGSAEVVKLLLEEGANPLAADGAGYSPLALAHINGNSKVYKLLKSKGATIKVPWNPLSE